MIKTNLEWEHHYHQLLNWVSSTIVVVVAIWQTRMEHQRYHNRDCQNRCCCYCCFTYSRWFHKLNKGRMTPPKWMNFLNHQPFDTNFETWAFSIFQFKNFYCKFSLVVAYMFSLKPYNIQTSLALDQCFKMSFECQYFLVW